MHTVKCTPVHRLYTIHPYTCNCRLHARAPQSSLVHPYITNEHPYISLQSLKISFAIQQQLPATMSIEEIPQGAEINIISKNEKKAREMIKKLGLKQVKGITRVTFKQRGNIIYAIKEPDVYRSPAGTYVVFGEAKVDDMNQRIAEAQAGQQAAQQGSGAEYPDKSPESITADLEKASLNTSAKDEIEEDNEEVDETGLDATDIGIIVEQTQVSRTKAAAALRKHKGDMVNAIMELS